MKSTTQSSLVAAAVAALVGTQAQALGPAAFTDGTIASSNFYYAAGAATTVPALFVAVNALLQSGTVDVYTDAAATAAHPQSTNFLVVSGKTSSTNALGGAANTFPANTNVALLFRISGGAFANGIQPFITGATLNYPTPASLAGGTLIAGGGHTSLNPTYRYTGANTDPHAPLFGLTDVAPPLFNYWWNLNGLSQPQSLAGVNSKGVWVESIGIAVTDNLYQKKKIWSRGEVAAVLTGSVSDWSQLDDDTGAPLAVGATILFEVGSGAGTKVADNEFFLNYPGGQSSLGGSLQPHSVISNTNVNGGYTGTALNTSLTTLQDIKEASIVAVADDLINANQAGLRALAMEGLAYPPHFEQHTAGINDYDFVSIDGSFIDSNSGTTDNINSPTGGTTTYSNITSGKYSYAFQASYNYKGALPGSGAFLFDVLSNLTSENLAGSHTGLAFPSAAPGILLDPVTTGNTDAGNLSWSRNGNSNQPPLFNATVAPAKPDPF
jgi:hypothetical protein